MSQFTTRVAPLDRKEFSADQEALAGEWSHLNFSRVIVRNPDAYRAFVPFIDKVIRGSCLPPRDREVLLIRTLALCGETYEAHHHELIARKTGMSEAEIAAAASADAGLSPWDRTLTQAADELVRDQAIGDATWMALAEHYDTEQMMEVVFAVGCYTVMAMLTKSFGVQVENDPGTFEALKAMRQYT